MAIGTNGKPAREARPGIYSAAISNFAAPFQTAPSAASRQTTVAMDQMLRNQAPPAGMPAVAPTRSARTPAAPTAPAAPSPVAPSSGPISQMAQIQANAGLPGYQDRVNAIPGPNNNNLEAAQRIKTRSKPGVSMAQPVSSTYPDETRRGAAQGIGPISQYARELNAADLTPQQRTDAGDAYRAAWQREAPGGLQRASGSILDLYNAEQQVRGTGIAAQRDANGRMSFSGDGTNALPQNYTQGVDLNLGNERMARANEIRQAYLDAQAGANGGPRGGVIRDSANTPEADLQKRIQALTGEVEKQLGRGRAGRNAIGALMQQFQGVTGAQRDIQRLAAEQANNQAGLDMRQQELAQRAAEGQQRFGLDQQRLAMDMPSVQGQVLQNQQTQMMQELTRKAISGDAEAIRQLQALQGRTAEDPRMRLLTTIAEAYTKSAASGLGGGPDFNTILNEVLPALGMQGVAQQAAPAAPSLQQFAAQIRARNPRQQISDAVINERYKQMYGAGNG